MVELKDYSITDSLLKADILFPFSFKNCCVITWWDPEGNGITSGFDGLNDITHGFHNSELIVIGAPLESKAIFSHGHGD